ncbi:hypothetical protein SCHPADRAFT_1002114 [Schizopora paradoxa]|uniref:Uncharacterized protein n=1 Tax=Schizopora paradoxa TaxID=27342 RepID=A0A0H2R4S1_9AGAM|nr:hypothetical protein SCHPADRAFT_1002114 [Schizopora paradoxa]
MGRPLFSTLIEPAVRVSEPVYTDEVIKGGGIACERWSITNPFDPDDDAFFDNEHAVYEAFLTDDEVRAQAQATRSVLSSFHGARAGRGPASTSELLEHRRLVERTNIRVPFEDLMGQEQSRTQAESERLLAAAEAPRSRRPASSRPEEGSTIPRAGVRIRTRVMNRMISGDATTVGSSSPRRGATENPPVRLHTRVDGSYTFAVGSAETQPTYPIRSAYSEERVRIPREQQEREIRENQMRLREVQLRAQEALRTRNLASDERAELARELRNHHIESYERRQHVAEQGARGTRHLDDVVGRIREGTELSASLIQRFPDSVEAREARDALNEADAMIEETLRRDDEMEQEIRALQDRDLDQDGGERNERLRAIQSRRIAINTDLDSLRPSRALSPSSVAASATSSSGSSRIVAPRMARSPISPPSAMPLHAFALPNMRTRARPRQPSDAESLDDMPGLLEVEHSSEDEDSFGSQTDSSSDWSTDLSGRSSPADERTVINPTYLVPVVPPQLDFDRHDWTFDGSRAARDAERSPSPPDLIVDTPVSTEASFTLASMSLDTMDLSTSPSTVYSTMPIPIPSTPSRSHARSASSGTPGAGGVLSMTPPASVTPRFLTWGGRSTSPSNATPASPSANRRRRTSATLPWLSSQNWNAF